MQAPVRRSLAFAFLENYAVMAIGVISLMLLARLLTPDDIGVFSVGAVTIAVAHIIRDFGVGQYLIQVRDLTTARLRAAFALQLTIAVALAAVLVALSGPIAVFYKRDELRTIISLLALNFALVPFSSIVLIWFRREFQYRAAFFTSVIGSAAGFIVSVALALAGYGYLSLVWGSVATSICTVITANAMRPAWFPWLPSFRGVREILRFGGYACGAGVVHEIQLASPDLVIGKALSVADVAIFGKATSLVATFSKFIMQAVWTVSTPAFAKQRHAGEDSSLAYSRAVSYVTGLAWPFFTFVAIMAFPIVRVVFGDQWDAAAPLIPILALRGAMGMSYSLVASVIMAHGRAKESFELNAWSAVVGVALLLIAVPHGLQMVAISVVAAGAFTLAYTNWMLRRVISISLRALFVSMMPSAFVAACVAVATAACLLLYGEGWYASPWSLVPGTASAFFAWVLAVMAIKHPLGDELLRLGRRLLALGPGGRPT